jgi:hypothetical protein
MNIHYAACAVLIFGTLSFQAASIKLESAPVKMLDGVPYALDGDCIKDMLHIRREIRIIQFGAKNPVTNTLEGCYHLGDKKYSIHELARMEHTVESDIATKKAAVRDRYLDTEAFQQDWEIAAHKLHQEHGQELDRREEQVRNSHAHDPVGLTIELAKVKGMLKLRYEAEEQRQHEALVRKHIRDIAAYDREIQELEAERLARLKPLHPCLHAAKEDFKRINEPYLASIHGTKAMMLILIEESCYKRGCCASFLLEWGLVNEGQELSSFDKSMRTLQALDIFCSDLTNFIDDVILSCPKGCAQAGLKIS